MPSISIPAAVLPAELPAGRRAGLWLLAALVAVGTLLWAWWPAGVALGLATGVLAVLAIGTRMEDEAAADPVDEELVARLGIAPAPVDTDLARAARLVVGTQYASAAGLARDLHLPYAHARRLIDELEREHVVGAAVGTRPRRVLVSADRLPALERRLAEARS